MLAGRYLFTNHNGVIDFELYGFYYASVEAYSAAVYARLCKNDIITTNLLTAKSKIVPSKILTVPPDFNLCHVSYCCVSSCWLKKHCLLRLTSRSLFVGQTKLLCGGSNLLIKIGKCGLKIVSQKFEKIFR